MIGDGQRQSLPSFQVGFWSKNRSFLAIFGVLVKNVDSRNSVLPNRFSHGFLRWKVVFGATVRAGSKFLLGARPK